MPSYFKNHTKARPLTSMGEARIPELFFAGVPKMIPICILRRHLREQFGPIKRLVLDKRDQLNQDTSSGGAYLHRGSGRITFNSMEKTRALIEKGGFNLEGKLIHVRVYLSKKAKQKKDKSVLDERRKVHIKGIPRYFSSRKYFFPATFCWKRVFMGV